MVVEHLAVHAVDALVGVDVPLRVDALHRALVGAPLARIAAFPVAAQPVEHPQPAGNSECGAERAQVAAEEALDEQACRNQCDGEE